MKRKKIILIMLAVIPAVLFAQKNIPSELTIQQDGNNYNIEFNLSDFEFETVEVTQQNGTTEFYQKIFVNDEFGIIDSVGIAEIPQLTFLFALPYNESSVNIEINNVETEKQQITNQIYPFQEPWETNRNISERPFSKNQNYYSSNGINYQAVKVSEQFIMAGVKGVRITINPFLYNPNTNELTIRRKINFKVKLNNSYNTKSINSIALDNYFNSLFVNYQPNITKSITYGNYLIVTAPQFEEMINRFANYKANIGYTVTVVNTDVTGSTRDNIKNYIQGLYDVSSTRPTFVLLVGDTDEIPNWIGSHSDNPPTDLNYSLLEGSDNEADVFLGRFSVDLNLELENIINKTIFMETNVQNLTKDVILAADFDCMGYFRAGHNSVKSVFEDKGYNWHKLYATKKDDDFCIIQVPNTHPASTTDLHNAINNNTTFFIYSGHGSRTAISDPRITTNHISTNTFSNTSFPFTFSFACFTNRFTENECVGEAWVRHDNCGVTYYGASIPTFYGTDEKLEKKIFNKGFDNADKEQIGPMVAYGMQKVLSSIASGSRKTRYVEMYNLLGDPSINTSGIDASCLPDYVFYNSVAYGNDDNITFNANNQIITGEGNAEFNVQGNANIELVAGNKIVLKPGTNIDPATGGSFVARIAPCNSTKSAKSEESVVQKTSSQEIKNNIDIKTSLEIIAYPNPFKDNCNIEYKLEEETNVKIEVFDLLGKKVFENNLTNLSIGNNMFVLTNKELSEKGIYVVKVQTNEYKETLFILKQ